MSLRKNKAMTTKSQYEALAKGGKLPKGYPDPADFQWVYGMSFDEFFRERDNQGTNAPFPETNTIPTQPSNSAQPPGPVAERKPADSLPASVTQTIQKGELMTVHKESCTRSRLAPPWLDVAAEGDFYDLIEDIAEESRVSEFLSSDICDWFDKNPNFDRDTFLEEIWLYLPAGLLYCFADFVAQVRGEDDEPSIFMRRLSKNFRELAEDFAALAEGKTKRAESTNVFRYEGAVASSIKSEDKGS